MRIVRKFPAAFSLVEVTLALGVAAFALITIFALLPVGLNSNLASIRETEATGVLTNIISDLRSTATAGTGAGTSPRLGINVAVSSSQTNPPTYYVDGGGGLTTASIARYRVTVTVTVPPTAGVTIARGATAVKVVVSWPATVPAANASGSVSAFVALDRN